MHWAFWSKEFNVVLEHLVGTTCLVTDCLSHASQQPNVVPPIQCSLLTSVAIHSRNEFTRFQWDTGKIRNWDQFIHTWLTLHICRKTTCIYGQADSNRSSWPKNSFSIFGIQTARREPGIAISEALCLSVLREFPDSTFPGHLVCLKTFARLFQAQIYLFCCRTIVSGKINVAINWRQFCCRNCLHLTEITSLSPHIRCEVLTRPHIWYEEI